MIPSIFIVQCPACGVALEAKLCGWQIMRATTDDGYGLALEMAAYAPHKCPNLEGEE